MAASVPNGMLRSALELAWAVARLGQDVRPQVPAPNRLRPLMRFAKLPDRALSTVRQVVEEDDEFRQRAAKAADEAELGRAGWLWLVRPDGWDSELAALAVDAGDEAVERQEEKAERRAQRRLRATETVVARAEARLTELQEVNARLGAQLTAERQGRRLAEAQRDRLEATRTAGGSERDRLALDVETLRARIVALEGAAGDSSAQVLGLTRDLEAARSEIENLQAALDEREAEMARMDGDRSRLETTLGDAVVRALLAARQVGGVLAEAAQTLGRPDVLGLPDPPDPAGSSDLVEPPDSGEVAGRNSHRRGHLTDSDSGRAHRAAQVRRRPAPLPPAIFDDSAEAARHLVRVRGMVLLVDGYNVTLSSWPGVELFEQRHRLVNALAELVTRTGTAVHVVFDGAEVQSRFDPPAAAGPRMRVTFSPEGVDADEVIIDLVDRHPPSQPIVVATDDRRVRNEAMRRGANVISVAQLLVALGRTPENSRPDL